MKPLHQTARILLFLWLMSGFVLSPALADNRVRQTFQQDAPSDTLTYWEGALSSVSMGSWSPNASQQVEQLIGQIQTLKSSFSPQSVDFITAIIRDYLEVIDGTPETLAQHYGLNKDQDMAIYLDGLSPIIQLAVASPDPIRRIVMDAVAASESPIKKAAWNGREVFLWDVVREPHLGFAIVFEPKRVTFGLYSDMDTQARTWRRLGLIPEAQSVFSHGTLAEIQQQYPFIGVFEGFVDLRRWVEFLSMDPRHLATQDLMLLDPSTEKQTSAVCQQEYAGLVENFPLFAAGYERFRRSENGVDGRVSGYLAIKQQANTAALVSLNGHLANHANSDRGQIASLAVGLDTQGVLAAITPLWEALADAEFVCPELRTWQQAVGPYNPATLAVGLALAQGVQGAAISLFDLTGLFDASDAGGVDALFTLSSSQPAALPALLSMLPQLQGAKLPTDSTPVPLRFGELPPSLVPMASIRGNHLAITLGPKSAQMAKSLDNEPLNQRGWLSMIVNSDRLSAQVFEPMWTSGTFTNSLEAEACIQMSLGASALRDSHVQMALKAGVNPQGVSVTIDQQTALNAQQRTPSLPVGAFDLATMGNGCQWEVFGTETLSPNGEGSYDILAPFDACSTWTARYQWQQRGRRLFYVETEALGRDDCGTPLVPQEPSNYDCVIVQSNDSGFSCLFQYEGGDMDLFRYTLKE